MGIQNRLYPGQPDVAKSYALRLLIHFVGDIHQPLHVETRYNDDYPTGDSGGNKFPLPNHYECDELHAVFDKVMYTQPHNIPRPFTDESYADFQESTVDPYMHRYPYTLHSERVNNLN